MGSKPIREIIRPNLHVIIIMIIEIAGKKIICTRICLYKHKYKHGQTVHRIEAIAKERKRHIEKQAIRHKKRKKQTINQF